MKLEQLFPVQKQVIPVILNQNKSQSIYPNDLCILAPTGSGKTLTYVLPIINSLKTRVKPCCRALVILPVSDLAEQVYNVFKTYLSDNESFNLINKDHEDLHSSNNLKCILLSNKNPFVKEQGLLINEDHQKCLIDIIITTPGRLVDHIQKTKHFDLTNLKYLVLDECDRIMEQIKQNWLTLLNQAIFKDNQRELLTNENLNVNNLMSDKKRLCPFQKLLLSATLTRNPENLEQMKLFQPVYFSFAGEKLTTEKNDEIKKLDTVDMADVSVPSELKEIFIQVILQQKPLISIHLIKNLGYKRMLIFVNSKETAKRLNKLFELNSITSMEYSSALHSARRKRIQSKFLDGKLDVLVCSDVMARGMDLENVDYVLMYDAPKHLSSYIHKAGRTARAGRSGTVITFLEHKEVYFFKKMVESIGSERNGENKHKVKEIKIQKSSFKNLMEDYKNSLDKLKDELSKQNKSSNGENKTNGFNKRKISNGSKFNTNKKFKPNKESS